MRNNPKMKKTLRKSITYNISTLSQSNFFLHFFSQAEGLVWNEKFNSSCFNYVFSFNFLTLKKGREKEIKNKKLAHLFSNQNNIKFEKLNSARFAFVYILPYHRILIVCTLLLNVLKSSKCKTELFLSQNPNDSIALVISK